MKPAPQQGLGIDDVQNHIDDVQKHFGLLALGGGRDEAYWMKATQKDIDIRTHFTRRQVLDFAIALSYARNPLPGHKPPREVLTFFPDELGEDDPGFVFPEIRNLVIQLMRNLVSLERRGRREYVASQIADKVMGVPVVSPGTITGNEGEKE